MNQDGIPKNPTGPTIDQRIKAIEAMAKLLDTVSSSCLEMAAGYRKKAMDLGFGSDAADQMAVQFHGEVMKHLLKGGG